MLEFTSCYFLNTCLILKYLFNCSYYFPLLKAGVLVGIYIIIKYVRMHLHVRTQAFTYVRMHACLHARICTHSHKFSYTHTHAHIHIYSYTRILTYVCVHIYFIKYNILFSSLLSTSISVL